MPALERIRLDRIMPNPDQPRRHFNRDELVELADSIAERGLMQPIKVKPVEDHANTFMIICGERRYRAHVLLFERDQLSDYSIDCIVQPMTDTEMAMQAIVENLQRADITPIEEARAYASMIARGFTIAELAKAVGVMQYRISEKLALLDVDEQVQKLIGSGAIPVTTAALLVKIPKDKQTDIVRRISNGTLRGNW
jgi:ParB family chromosome partitioning protein